MVHFLLFESCEIICLRNACRRAPSLQGDDYAAHTTCISEAEKYEKSVYKPKKGKAVKKNPQVR
jgi:LYAR-type C2HC zinc finger